MSPKSLILAAGLALVVAVVATGIVIGRDDPGLSVTPSAAAPTSADGPPSSGALSGPRLPALTASSTTGEIDFASLRGPAVIHVFASWCEVCQAEAKGFSTALRSAPGVRPIYVAVQDEPADSAAFVTSSGWRKGAIVHDPDRSIESRLGLSGQPHTILVDRDGNTQTILGGSNTEQLAALLQAISA